MVFKSIFLLVVCAGCVQMQAQNAFQSIPEPTVLTMSETGPYSIVERSDWRRYDKQKDEAKEKYTGLVRHEVRASIMPKSAASNNGNSHNALLYQGNFFVLENTLRDMRQSAQAVDAVVPVSFQLYKNGSITIENDRGYPTLRGFPAFPTQRLMPNDRWSAPGNRAVDPLHTGRPVIVPFTANYTYKGKETYKYKNKETWVHRIYAEYSCNYTNKMPTAQNFVQIKNSSHRVDILIRVEDGLPLFMRDNLDETYIMPDGSTIRFVGFILTFGEGIVPLDRGEVIASLGNMLKIEQLPDPEIVVSDPKPEPIPVPAIIEPEPMFFPAPPTAAVIPEPEPGPSEAEDQAADPVPEKPALNTEGFQDSAIDLTPVPEGIRLTVKDIRFAPDSANFLPTEKSRLDLLAEALKQIPDRSFLVEGHTAATGRPGGEMDLSIERAKRMVDELVNRGINPDRFIYKGWGGTRPIGDNSTNTGRSRNRRVEITILE